MGWLLWNHLSIGSGSKNRRMRTTLSLSSLKRHNSVDTRKMNLVWVGIRVCLLVTGIVDSIVNNGQGFSTVRRWVVGHGVTGTDPNMDCPYDYEGSWAIGMITSKSSSSSSPVDGVMWQELVDASPQPTISCATVKKNTKLSDLPNISFVADPFLLQKSKEEWYVFFEYKNVDKYIGELGVAKSVDQGKTFEYLGTILQEDGIHLSYPQVLVKHNDPNTYQMIPETNQAKEVRVYETSVDEFPFGWKHVATPLKGQALVDTSVVWYEDRYVIFTSTPGIWGRSIHLYEAVDLTKDVWKPHPMNPVVKSSFSYGRSGGRPFVYQNHIYRLAQDGTNFYGQAIHMLRIHVLSPTLYQEQHVSTIQPKPHNPWTRSRFHHMDIQPFEGNYVAFFDADAHTDYDEFLHREAWFYYTRKLIFGITFLYVLRDLYKILFQPYIYPFFLHRYNHHHRTPNNNNNMSNKSLSSREITSLISTPSSPLPTTIHTPSKKSVKDMWMQKWKALPLWRCIIYIVASVCLAVMALVIFSDMKHSCVESDSHPTAVCMRSDYAQTYTRDTTLQLALNLPTTTTTTKKEEKKELLIVTAASTSFMIRLRNLVGSVHYWEPQVEILIYDLGFTAQDLHEIRSWKRCQIIPFPFDDYPPHVQLLYNFAWKIVLFHHALETYGNFMYIDAGLEVLRPLAGVRHYLQTDGYFSSIITNTIGRETHPSLYSKLDDIMKKQHPDKFEPMNIPTIKEAPFCAGGIQGFVKGSKAEELILKPAMVCALDEHCIAPPGSGRNNHNYDQSVLATLAHANGLGHMCHDRKVYCSPMTIDYTIDETRCNGLEIAGRRWRGPRRYPKHIDLHYHPPTTEKNTKVVKTVEVLTGKKPQSESAWQECQDQCSVDYTTHKNKQKWDTCLAKCPKDTPKQFWDSDKIDVVVIEYFSYWLKGLLLGCANYRLHTFLLSIALFLLIVYHDPTNTIIKDEKEKQ